MKKETLQRTWDQGGTVRTEIRQTLAPGSSQVLAQTIEKYQVFSWGERLVQRIEGTGAALRTNSYTYFEDSFHAIYRGRLRQMTRDNYTENYDYDDQGRLTHTSSGHDALGRKDVNYYFEQIPPGFTDDPNCWPLHPRRTLTSLNGSGIGTAYFVASGSTTIDIRGLDPSASTFLCTTNRYYTPSDTNAWRLKSIEPPDGTITLYYYGTNLLNCTNIVLSGQPNSAHDGILSGTRAVTVLGGVGEVLLEETYDVAPEHS